MGLLVKVCQKLLQITVQLWGRLTDVQEDICNAISGMGLLLDASRRDQLLEILRSGANSPGTASQYWRGDHAWADLNKSAVGLGFVDDTADVDKPVSTAQQKAIDDAIAALVGGAPGALDTLKELADAINDDASFASRVTMALGLKAPLDSPTLTGTPSAPTPGVGDKTKKVATTEFVSMAIADAVSGGDSQFEVSGSVVKVGSGVILKPTASHLGQLDVDFDSPFPNSCYGVFPVTNVKAISAGGGNAVPVILSKTASGFAIQVDSNNYAGNDQGNLLVDIPFDWVAFGA